MNTDQTLAVTSQLQYLVCHCRTYRNECVTVSKQFIFAASLPDGKRKPPLL